MSEYNYQNQQPVAQNSRGSRGPAIASMVLGIMSICGSWTAIVGVIMAIIALVLAKKATDSGNKSIFATIGKITGIIGLIVGIFMIIAAVISFIFWVVVGIGGAAASIVDFAELFNF